MLACEGNDQARKKKGYNYVASAEKCVTNKGNGKLVLLPHGLLLFRSGSQSTKKELRHSHARKAFDLLLVCEQKLSCGLSR